MRRISAAGIGGTLSPASVSGRVGAASVAGEVRPVSMGGAITAAEIAGTVAGAALTGTVALASDVADYPGPYEASALFAAQSFGTAGKLMRKDFAVRAINYTEAPNEYGTTVTIGG